MREGFGLHRNSKALGKDRRVALSSTLQNVELPSTKCQSCVPAFMRRPETPHISEGCPVAGKGEGLLYGSLG